jgi:hypothetical protein
VTDKRRPSRPKPPGERHRRRVQAPSHMLLPRSALAPALLRLECGLSLRANRRPSLLQTQAGCRRRRDTVRMRAARGRPWICGREAVTTARCRGSRP